MTLCKQAICLFLKENRIEAVDKTGVEGVSLIPGEQELSSLVERIKKINKFSSGIKKVQKL